ncbi:helicase-related protein [Tomitella fengzijianii]|nr:helicase-related protein [Tomitella fengzijianii]
MSAAGTAGPDAWPFDADPARFRLAAEALRIRMAGLHDPMVAVTSSEVRPLPHQIRAVYGELLPRTPLRFLLADDPGAGKTIMAGLYAKELMLRGDLTRMLVIAPGSLVEQWREELAVRFDIHARTLDRPLIERSPGGDPFPAHPLMIARMDQLARDEQLQEHLAATEWDLIVVDEAHRMSARWWGGELKTTRRYELGRSLDAVTRHLLLMTATPHSGSEEDYQAFLALLDPDRFAGRYREGAHTLDTTGIMRRMVKEELLTFEGTPLFPERVAETVPYSLSPAERELYEAVTDYVRTEMNRAEALDGSRTRTVGFALTVLQRRLASSAHAIARSLTRRRDRLRTRLDDMEAGRTAAAQPPAHLPHRIPELDDLDAAEAELLEEQVADAATAAETAAELRVEIARLDQLVELATWVRDGGQDRKWAELRTLLLDRALLRTADGAPRKLIVFTEHRDTLDHLATQIEGLLGRPDAVLTIHGGTPRARRHAIRERFTHDPTAQVLVATDAAGEGLNLQAAHLMINYDLPWNPNRIEQRFGRIHRIGQEHVCRLWNLVADDTREGQVFNRLLEKMDAQRKAYGGRLFDVLGEAFSEQPLRDLLVRAVRYGDDPARMRELQSVVDSEVSDGLTSLVHERALARETIGPVELERMRRTMDEARARRLQPHYVESLFTEAFRRLGGAMSPREGTRREITHVPAALRRAGADDPGARPVTTRYHRVTFDPEDIDRAGAPRAELLAPGHPLVDAVLDATIEHNADALRRGAVLCVAGDAEHGDGGTDVDGGVRLLVALTSEVVDGDGSVVDKRFAFVALDSQGHGHDLGMAPYLDAGPPPAGLDVDAAAARLGGASAARSMALHWAASEFQPGQLDEARGRVEPIVERTRTAVTKRLTQQINFLHAEATRVKQAEEAGSTRTVRTPPARLRSRAEALEQRMQARRAQLDARGRLTARPPEIIGAAILAPASTAASASSAPTAGALPSPTDTPPDGSAEPGSPAVPDGSAEPRRVPESAAPPPRHAVDTVTSDRRAVAMVLAAERALGRTPEEMPHNNPGFDIRSTTADGRTLLIEVKGRVMGADTFFVTRNEVTIGRNTGLQHRLALVAVSPDGPEHDQLRYVVDAFRHWNFGSFAATGIEAKWRDVWEAGGAPV